MRLSTQQRTILTALAGEPRGWLPTEAFHELLFGVASVRRLRTTPLTPSQRASLSRSLSRLESAGLASRPRGRMAWFATDAGRAAAGRLTSRKKIADTLTDADAA